MEDIGTNPVSGEKPRDLERSQSSFRTPQSALRNSVCPSCRSEPPPADVKAARHYAWCPKCKAPFALDVPAVTTRPPVPAGVQVTDDGVSRRLAVRWFRWHTPLLLLLCVGGNALVAGMWSRAISRWPVPWIDVALPMWFSGCVGVVTYRTLCDLVNRTAIEAGDVLRVRHGPMPWRGAEVPATDVVAVVTVPVLSRGKGQSAGVTFTVRAETESGPAVVLLADVESLPRAQFIEWQLEDWLDLSDAPPEGS